MQMWPSYAFVLIIILPVCCSAAGATLECHAPPPLLDAERLHAEHPSCVEYKMACVDQEAIIVYDPVYASQGHGKNLPVPPDLTKLSGWFRHKRHRLPAQAHNAAAARSKEETRRLLKEESASKQKKDEKQKKEAPRQQRSSEDAHALELDVVAGTAMKLGPLPVRLPAALEEGIEGGAPQYFSACTLPLILFQHWPNNLGEFQSRTVSFLHSWQNEVQPPLIDGNVTIVLGRFAKLPLEPFNTFLTQPYSRYAITSFASFSSRLPSSTPSNATAEGRHVRCFQRMMVCAFEGGKYPGMFQAAHNTMRYYAPSIPNIDGYWQQEPNVLRILFEVRPAAMARQIVNLDEILDMCATGVFKVPNNSIWKRVQCRKHVFGHNLLRDMAVARQADVLVSHHGAGQMNSLYMREYSSILELRPYEFGTKFGWMPAFWWPLVGPQNGNKVMYWGVNLEDKKYYVMSGLERYARLRGDDSGLGEMQVVQSRHLAIPPQVLQGMLDKIVVTARNASLYRQKYCSNEVLFTLNEEGQLTPAVLFPDYKCSAK